MYAYGPKTSIYFSLSREFNAHLKYTKVILSTVKIILHFFISD